MVEDHEQDNIKRPQIEGKIMLIWRVIKLWIVTRLASYFRSYIQTPAWVTRVRVKDIVQMKATAVAWEFSELD